MISINKNRLDTHEQLDRKAVEQVRDTGEQERQLSGEIIAQVKKLAVEKPVVVVAAGLAIGVVTGLILKRR